MGPDIETKYWVDSEFPEYPQISLKSAGQGLLDAIKNSEGVNRPLEDHLKPFVIAHSQGGLAVRAADLERTNTQKGILILVELLHMERHMEEHLFCSMWMTW